MQWRVTGPVLPNRGVHNKVLLVKCTDLPDVVPKAEVCKCCGDDMGQNAPPVGTVFIVLRCAILGSPIADFRQLILHSLSCICELKDDFLFKIGTRLIT
jgi:hypothetical protein